MSMADDILTRAVRSAASFRALGQRETDAAVRAVYLAALDARVALARLAHEETGIGVWQDKVVKNVIAALLVYEDIKDQKTVGVISEDSKTGIIEVAQPLGPILGFVPVTNPTSTAIFKALIALKTRNPLIVCPPQGARRSVAEAVRVCYEAARRAGAPEDCLLCLDRPSRQTVEEIMRDPLLALILATGKDSLVRRAASSGTPVLGVGPGNVPVYIGVSADIPFAVRSIIESKTFDHGSVCASEQAVVVRRDVAERVFEEFRKQGAHILTFEECERVSRLAFDPDRGAMNPSIVGRSARDIAGRAGVPVPPETVLLVAILDAVGPDAPLSAEILAPILALYVAEDFDEAISRSSQITRYGGAGHTAVIYSNTDERIEYFSRVIDASRILVNTPSTQGAIGGIYNTLSPSFTLSCGSGGRNITTDNITARHLLNIRRITRRQPNARWFSLDRNALADEAVSAEEIEAAFRRNS
jgi:acetaldehyde dehydrogenase/alcohol dehydrogenase